MANLLGKADATLVKAATGAAKADNIGDLSNVYKAKAESAKMFTDKVSNYFEAYNQKNKELGDLVEQNIKTIGENLNAGIYNDEEGQAMFNDYVGSVKLEIENAKNPAEKNKVLKRLDVLKNSTDDMDNTLTGIISLMSTPGSYVKQATTNENFTILNQISEGKAKRIIENDQVYYSVTTGEGEDAKTLKLSAGDLKNVLTVIDPEANGARDNVTMSIGDISKKNQNATWEQTRKESIYGYENAFNTPQALAQSIHVKQKGMDYSVVDILYGKEGVDPTTNIEIYKGLKERGLDVPTEDKNNDGVINEKDFETAAMGIEFIKRLTLPTYEGFMFTQAKTVAAEIYADNLAYNEFYKHRKKPGTGPEKISFKGKTYSQQDFAKQIGPVIDFLNNPTEGKSMQLKGSPLFKYENGNWYTTIDGKYSKTTLSDLSTQLELYNYVGQGGEEPTYNTDYYTQ